VSDVTEYDLLDALNENLPKPLQPGEFTVSSWAEHFHVTYTLASSKVRTLEETGKIVRVPELRISKKGKLSQAFRVVPSK
jgi:hypothetical protein